MSSFSGIGQTGAYLSLSFSTNNSHPSQEIAIRNKENANSPTAPLGATFIFSQQLLRPAVTELDVA
jgi:hypothetical protein